MSKNKSSLLKKIGLSLFLFAAIGAFLFWKYLTPHYNKLGETTILKSDEIEVKVVTRHEYLPLHYIGDAYSIACKSKNTSQFSARKHSFIENGWNEIPSPTLNCLIDDQIKCDHLSIAEKAKPHFLLLGNQTLVMVRDEMLAVSFNGCNTFQIWDYKKFTKRFTSSKFF